MTPAATVALVLAAVAAVVNWWAVAAGRRAVEVVAKPTATAALVVVAATAGTMDTEARVALVVAVVFGLLGDVALLGSSEARFLGGLGAFAIGHAAYVVTALLVGISWPWTLVGVPFMIVLLVWRFAPETVPGARRAGGAVLAGAVLGYATVISAMVLSAAGTRSVLAAVGAMAFAVSDWLLGFDRFVRPIRNGRVAVMVTYHTGQALLILGLALTD